MLSAFKPALAVVLIGSIGGLAGWLVQAPAPWLLGAALFVSLAAIGGVNVALPNALRDAVFIVIGMTMGAGVTPETVATAAQWPLSLVTLFAGLIAIMAVSTYALRRLFAYDKATATLASAPGHLSFVLSLSTETNANIATLSIVQTMRVLTLTLAVPLVVSLLYPGLEPRFVLDGASMPVWGLAIVGALAIAVGRGLKKLRVPAAYLLGGLFASASLHVTDVLPGVVPAWLTIPAFGLMGTLIGTRFNNTGWRSIRAALGASFASTAIALVISGLAAAFVSLFITVEPAHLLIAFAPGGLETMAAMGIMLGANPAFIAAHHVSRILFLTALIPLVLHWTSKR